MVTEKPSRRRIGVMPCAYRHASGEWRARLSGLRAETMVPSDNTLYTATEAVLKSFRARLTPQQALTFADLLPTVLRAIFVSGWYIDAPLRDWPDREALRGERLAWRRHHNVSPPELLEHLLAAVPATMRAPDLDRVLNRIGPGARAFWGIG